MINLFVSEHTSPIPCVDKIPNCNEYDADLCTNPLYRLFREDNCRKFCSLCTGMYKRIIIHYFSFSFPGISCKIPKLFKYNYGHLVVVKCQSKGTLQNHNQHSDSWEQDINFQYSVHDTDNRFFCTIISYPCSVRDTCNEFLF